MGFAPTGGSGGTNPLQIGSGVQTVTITTDFSQGTIATGSDPSQLALQGDGFFIVETDGGGRAYTRDRQFHINGNEELVATTGDRVLGFGVDSNFQIQTTELVPLRISVRASAAASDGSAAVLTGFTVENNGRISGNFSDGVRRTLGQIQIARFSDPAGLEQRGENLSATGPNSGLPLVTNPGAVGGATIVAGATELSNTDIGQSLVDLTLASVQFRASAAVFGTASLMFEKLTNLRR